MIFKSKRKLVEEHWDTLRRFKQATHLAYYFNDQYKKMLKERNNLIDDIDKIRKENYELRLENIHLKKEG